MKRILFAVLALTMCMMFITGCGKEVVYEGKTTASPNSSNTNQNGGITMNYDEAYDYQTKDPVKGETIAVIHTNYGDIKMRFLDKVAPLASENFITLAKDGKYDNTIFHRVISNFMIQGGDYTNFNGTGGESCFGYEFKNEVHQYISNIEGSVAMANRGPDTNGSQFYINQVDNKYLDGGYTVFGWVYDGMDVVHSIASVQTGPNDRPVNDVKVESVEVMEFEG